MDSKPNGLETLGSGIGDLLGEFGLTSTSTRFSVEDYVEKYLEDLDIKAKIVSFRWCILVLKAATPEDRVALVYSKPDLLAKLKKNYKELVCDVLISKL